MFIYTAAQCKVWSLTRKSAPWSIFSSFIDPFININSQHTCTLHTHRVISLWKIQRNSWQEKKENFVFGDKCHRQQSQIWDWRWNSELKLDAGSSASSHLQSYSPGYSSQSHISLLALLSISKFVERVFRLSYWDFLPFHCIKLPWTHDQIPAVKLSSQTIPLMKNCVNGYAGLQSWQ